MDVNILIRHIHSFNCFKVVNAVVATACGVSGTGKSTGVEGGSFY